MEELFDLALFFSITGVLEVLSVVFSLLFMHYSAKHRNQKLSAGWYVCGVLFGFWTLIVFLVKRKDFPGPDTKVCYQCGDRFFEKFEICPKCLIALPENNQEEKKKQRKLSQLFGTAVIILYILAFIFGIVMGISGVLSVFDDTYNDAYNDRIAVDGVFYDKKGISYEDEDSVLLYDEDGRIYTYTVEEYSDGDGWLYEDEFYVRDDGEKYYMYDCYVTEDGWFYCDKAGILELYSTDTSNMTEDELNAYYSEMLESRNEDYRYYNYPYVDAEGNYYFDAYEASWNENGELITAENDIYG